MAKEGYISLTELRRFLCGLKDGKESKVYLKISQKYNHNYLDVYVENNFTDEIRKQYNGFHHMYQLKMNEMDTKNYTKLSERPINPRTGFPYKEGTKKFNEWWVNLNPTDKKVYADLTANI